MLDAFNRNIDYMRISITDKCNLRCKYCMPEEIKHLEMKELLTFEELQQVVKQAAALGIKKIKLTGGEPLVRNGAPKLVGMIKAVAGIEEVTMTSNGVLLKAFINELKGNGLDAVNVSLDTVNPREFENITGRDDLAKVLSGIDAAIESGIPVKLNTVLRTDITEKTIIDLIEYARGKKIDIRFIELMPIGVGKGLSGMSNAELVDIIEREYGILEPDLTLHGNGPAKYYKIPGYDGSIGFISAMHGKFCSSCNRIRMTATGDLKACLCYKSDVSIRQPLREGKLDDVSAILRDTIWNKPKQHNFEDVEKITEKQKMISIGG